MSGRSFVWVWSFGVAKATNLSNTRLHVLSDESDFEQISFDAKAESEQFIASTYKVEDTIGSNLEIQIPALFLLITGAGPNLISKSIVPPPCWNSFQCLFLQRLQNLNKKPLDLECVMLLNVRIRDLEIPVWFSGLKELSFDIPDGTSFKNRYVWGILFPLLEVTFRKSKPIYINAIKRVSVKWTTAIFANDKLTVAESPN